MHSPVYALLLTTCIAAFASTPISTLRIATYNLENYTLANRMTESGFKLEYPKPEEAKRALLATLKVLDADVLILQEMGSIPYLLELQHDLRMLGIPYPYSHLVPAGDASRHLAALSRLPWKQATSHCDLDFKYFAGRERIKRGLLEIEFQTRAGPLTVWGVHLKSRFTDRPDDPQSALRRAGEAVAVREAILRRHPPGCGDRYLLVGDFNDVRHARPLRACLARGQTPISTLLAARDSRGELWTRFHRKDDSYERVDFILCSSTLLPAVKDGTAQLCDAPSVRLASDHRPVFVSLDFR